MKHPREPLAVAEVSTRTLSGHGSSIGSETKLSEFVPFALPDIGEREISAVVEAMRSGWVSSGPKVKEFEAAFGEFIGPGVEAIAVNSATAGLHLALEAVGIGPGDEVLVPTWTFTATAEVVRYLGAEPVFVDVDSDTLTLDLAQAAQKVTDRTAAVMPVHFAGQAMDLALLESWSHSRGLAVIEDAAHALPATSRGRLVGSGASRATVFSFYATKTMTTGEGGMIVTRDSSIAERVRVMRLHGIDRDAFGRYRSEMPSWQYDVIAPGYKYNMGDPAAALGLVQLERAAEMRQRREEIAARYSRELVGLPLELPSETPSDDLHSWHLYVVRIAADARLSRDAVVARLAAVGVGSSLHFIPLHLLTYWRERYDLRPEEFPVASREFERVVSLPIYSGMSDYAVDRVVSGVREAFA